ncbi:hypothetical protein PVL29_012538 [Vitis rotundifolia]|uniref:HMA domain-containing protein n=1 Tax=Vitis rotundifolia TaxID=103349 RepID=A0AA39DN19_VITRO|nr:hypothetical protein PVL29_012538 [Vitis rotundifolia]
MKQKVVISVSFNGNKNCQSKALKIAAGFSGVNSTALEGQDKNQIVVVGENIDVIELVKKLKKKVGFSTLNSVTPVDGEEKEEDEGEKPMEWPHSQVGIPQYYLYDVPLNRSNDCSIL